MWLSPLQHPHIPLWPLQVPPGSLLQGPLKIPSESPSLLGWLPDKGWYWSHSISERFSWPSNSAMSPAQLLWRWLKHSKVNWFNLVHLVVSSQASVQGYKGTLLCFSASITSQPSSSDGAWKLQNLNPGGSSSLLIFITRLDLHVVPQATESPGPERL